jgi:hypothetical protein
VALSGVARKGDEGSVPVCTRHEIAKLDCLSWTRPRKGVESLERFGCSCRAGVARAEISCWGKVLCCAGEREEQRKENSG